MVSDSQSFTQMLTFQPRKRNVERKEREKGKKKKSSPDSLSVPVASKKIFMKVQILSHIFSAVPK